MELQSLRALLGSVLMLCAWLQLAVAATEHTEPRLPPASTQVISAAPLMATLTMPSAQPGTPVPAVVFVHDALGPDMRGDAYAEQIVAAGIAVLEILCDETDPATVGLAVNALARDPQVDAGRIGVLGFGSGGLVAARLPGLFKAMALLYPGCAALDDDSAAIPLAAVSVLVAYGTADLVNPPAACSALAEAMTNRGAIVRRIEYGGAGYGWDRPAYGLEGRSLLPRPDGGAERVAAVPWPAVAGQSATQVAGFFAVALGAGQR